MLVFSSAEITNSSSRSGLRLQTRSYRSKRRPAFAAKSGSRGKIHVRCCQGRIASECSHRQTVLSLIVATSPDWRTWVPNSLTLQRDSGISCVAGSSQGKRLNLNDQFWGEKPGVARGDRVLQAPRGALRRTVFATCSPLHGAYRDAKQFRRLTVLRPPLGSSSRAVPENTVTYIVLLVDVTPAIPTSTR